MTKVRDIMSEDVEFVREDQTVREIARTLAEKDIGAAPVCGSDGRLKGVVTDRDLVVRVLAEGKDPESVTAAELGQGDSETVTIGADDGVDEAAATMQEKGVRRLPVIDGDKVIGMLSLGDLARADKDDLAGNTVERLVSTPPNN